MTRERVSLALEALLWIAALAWLIFLAADIAIGMRLYFRVCGMDSLHWLQGCPPASLPWRSIGELVLLGLLVWWPMIRTRIRFGHWMRDWEDHPARHFSDRDRLAPRQ